MDTILNRHKVVIYTLTKVLIINSTNCILGIICEYEIYYSIGIMKKKIRTN